MTTADYVRVTRYIAQSLADYSLNTLYEYTGIGRDRLRTLRQQPGSVTIGELAILTNHGIIAVEITTKYPK